MVQPVVPPLSAWKWEPNESYGPIHRRLKSIDLPPGFVVGVEDRGSDIPEEIRDLTVLITAIDGLRLSEEDGYVTEAKCEEEFWINKQNIIGRPLVEAISILGRSPDEEEEYGDGLMFARFRAWGLSLYADDCAEHHVSLVSLAFDPYDDE